MDRTYWVGGYESVDSPGVERQVIELLRRGCIPDSPGVSADSGWDRTLQAIRDVFADARRRAGRRRNR